MGVDYRMDFYTKDFLSSTATMTGPERAAYALSLVVGWTQGGTLPSDPSRIRRAMGFDVDEWDSVWPAIEAKWPVVGDHRENCRQRKELYKAVSRSESASDASRKANAVRWGKPSESEKDSPSSVSRIPSSVLRTPSSEHRKPSGEGEKPRSLEEVQEYAKEIPGLDASAFWDFYSSKGWKVGTQPMRDWRAAARNWLRRDKSDGKVVPQKGKSWEDEEYHEALRKTRADVAAAAKLRKEKGLDNG